MALLIAEFHLKNNFKLSKGVDAIVATPGRLLDHMECGTVLLKDVKLLIADIN